MKRREFLKGGAALVAGTAATKARGAARRSDSAAGAAMMASDLRCEYAKDPLGIDARSPRLSWILEGRSAGARGLRQSAYRVLAAGSPTLLASGAGDLWDSGRMTSSRSIQIAYAGKPLGSRQAVWWKVMVWDQDDRQSSWSEPASFSMGLLEKSDWTAQWIGVEGGEGMPEEFSGADWIAAGDSGNAPLWFRCRFDLDETNYASYALLAMLGSRQITVSINGAKVHSAAARLRLPYVAQDVTRMVHPGHNILAVRMEAGSDSPGIFGGLTLDLAEGEIEHLRTGPQWKVSSAEQPGWDTAAFDDSQWESAKTVAALPFPEAIRAGERTRLPARMLRKDFTLDRSPARATAYLSGVGFSELFLNGKKVSADVLSPGLSDYDKRVFYRTYDVTPHLRGGRNTVGVHLGNARCYAPRRNVGAYTRTFGHPKALFQLEIENAQAERTTVAGGQDWTATTEGPVRSNNHYDGEEYDARMEQAGWAEPGFHDDHWHAATIMPAPAGAVSAQMSDPMRTMQEIRPVKITQPKPEVFVFDLGQNIAGWSRLRVSGAAGTAVTLRYAETLRENGMLYTDNLRSARQKDIYVLKGTGDEIFEPRFTSHGFRFVELRGYPGTPQLSSLVGCVVHDALEEHADLTTSDRTIDAVYRNTLWGDRGNYQSIPTDCCQRDERQGWLGDRSAESKGESYMFDVSRFYTQWMQHMDDSQDAAGRINDVAPAYWPFYHENVVWPASFFLVADMLYLQYGDEAVIRKHYPAMKRCMEHMYGLLRGGLMPIDTYGDWCMPPKSLTLIHSNDPSTQTAAEVLGSTYFYLLLQCMARFAEISGNRADRAGFETIAADLKTSFNRKYLHPETGLYDNGTQTSSVLALALGLAPEEQREAIFAALAHNVETVSNGHVGTGLVGAQWLMQTLTRNGRPDLACGIASETTYPSWGYMIHRGATTIWELWNGDTADPAMNSRNHLMLLGDFATWLYEDAAGIAPDRANPGFAHILVHPKLTGELTSAGATHNSPHGLISSAWTRAGKTFTLRLTIPPNTTAEVAVPAQKVSAVFEGEGETRKRAERARGVRFARWMAPMGKIPGASVFHLGSGEYS